MNEALDRRLNAFRDDLADERLRGRVDAPNHVAGKLSRVIAPFADLRGKPGPGAGLDAQLLHGDRVRVFERADGWAWVQNERDGYVGYVKAAALSSKPEHRAPRDRIVMMPRTFCYRDPDMKSSATRALSLGSALRFTAEEMTRGLAYAQTCDGDWIIASHTAHHPLVAAPVGDDGKTVPPPRFRDYVAFAEALIHAPYLWGGNTAFGIDCSGLVQLTMLMTGRKVLRDSDMQAATIGEELGFAAMNGGLQRGDLVFWKGHVGIMSDCETLIHANGHTMTVALEKLEDAIERIGYLYGSPTRLRRP